jgi:hypothetical protein
VFAVALNDPDGVWKGRFQAQLSNQGLELFQEGNVLLLPVGSPARHLRRNVLTVTCGGREVKLTVTKLLSYQNRLAHDLAEYLNGDRPLPRAADYALTWYFYVPVALPVGIPVLTLGGALPAAIGFGLAGANFAIVQRETWPKAARLAVTLSTALGAYLILAVLLWFGWGWGGGIADSAWQPFSPADGRFNVLLPGQNTVQTTTQQTPAGAVTTVLHLVDLKQSAYGVGYSNIPPAALAQLAPEAHLDAVRDAMVQSRKGKLLNEQKISLDSHPGREFAMVTGDPKGSGVVRIYRVGDQLYQLLVLGRNISPTSPDVRKFLESFKLSAARPAADTPRRPAPAPSDRPQTPAPGTPQFEESAEKGYVKIKGLAGEVRGLAFSADGRMLAVAAGPEVRLVDVVARAAPALRDRPDGLSSLAMTADGQTIVTGNWNGVLQVWDVPKRQVRLTLDGPSGEGVFALALSPDGKTLAVGWSDGSVRRWDVEPWRERNRLRGPAKDLVRSLAFSRDGRLLASECVFNDPTVRLWDLEKGRQRGELPGKSGNPFGNALALSSDGRLLAAFGPQDTLKVWEVDSGKERQSWPVQSHTRCLALSPDDGLLAYAGGYGMVGLTDLRTGKRGGLPQGHYGGVLALAFSPDSKTLAVGSSLEVRIWELSRVWR